MYIPSSDDYTKPGDLQNFIDNALSSPVVYVLGRNPKAEAFVFAPSHNATTYQAHIAIKLSHRDGTIARRAAEAGKWLFEHTTCRAIIGFVLEKNRPAKLMQTHIGMKRIGKTSKTVLFNGKYQDEIIYQCTVDDYNALWGDKLGRIE